MSVEKAPSRQCIDCQEMKSGEEVTRVVKTAEDEIMLDAISRKNGRGAHLCPLMECLKKAVKSKELDRSFKVPIPKEVYEVLERKMEELGKQ